MSSKIELVECDACPTSGGCVSTCMRAAPVVEQTLREHCKQCAEVVKTWPESKRGCLGPVVERQPVELSIPDECPHLIVFDDNDRENMLFAGAGARSAALKTWEKISASWNAHLFVRIERNCRDDRYPSAHAAPPKLAELQATIADLTEENARNASDLVQVNLMLDDAEKEVDRLKAEIERLKGGQGEPVAWAANSDLAAIKHGALFSGTLWGVKNPPMLEGRKPLFASQPAPVSVVLPDNLESHRNTWIQAMERLVELEPESCAPDEDEKGFWRHELQAMCDMYTDLDKVKELNQ